MESFAHKFKCDLTVLKNGEHWFHTEKQLEILSDWVKRNVPLKKEPAKER